MSAIFVLVSIVTEKFNREQIFFEDKDSVSILHWLLKRPLIV